MYILVPICIITESTMDPPDIIYRASWGARPALSTNRLYEEPAPFVVLHESAGSFCYHKVSCKAEVQSIQDHQMTIQGWDDIGYNFMIGGEGTIFEGRGWILAGSHITTRMYINNRSIGICLLGKFDDRHPPAAQLMALEALISFGVENGYIKKDYHLIGHRQIKNNNCPGKKMYSVLRLMPHYDPNL
ncbi:hypothetical protein ABEB36_011436 [Hypothenemus hampei]|uniref:Peptidoglycan-recognition protein n=1 Tax=Hypothenemus hampei TaxID=57062 RepID=A0ABD1EFP0_HYPHA